MHINKIREQETPKQLTIYWEINEEGLFSFWKESMKEINLRTCVRVESANQYKTKVVLFLTVIFLRLSCTTSSVSFTFSWSLTPGCQPSKGGTFHLNRSTISGPQHMIHSILPLGVKLTLQHWVIILRKQWRQIKEILHLAALTFCNCWLCRELSWLLKKKTVKYLARFQSFGWWVWTIAPQETTRQHQGLPEHTVCLEQAKIHTEFNCWCRRATRKLHFSSSKNTFSIRTALLWGLKWFHAEHTGRERE